VADSPPDNPQRKSRYTAARGMPGSFEGETVTRRAFMTGGVLAAGGIATAAFGLPALGFALGPVLEKTQQTTWQDVGPEDDFNDQSYVPKVTNIDPAIGDPGKTTIYVRKFSPGRDKVIKGEDPQPYVAISTRCAHLGCPVRYIQASQKFVCPCHGGIYDAQGKVAGGPPVRPLDRFYTREANGRVLVGKRFSLNSKLERFPHPRDPSNHLDGLWQYLYPGRPTT
jgi:menaquinol-cytochrome c reductase iron-sulfur subunit